MKVITNEADMKHSCILWMTCILLILTIPLLGQNKEKIHIAVLDFSNTGGLSKFETVTLSTRLSSMLVKTEAFIVLERGKMDEILNEQGFQQSGCTTTECAVEVGKLLNVQKMVSGSIGKIGKTYTIDISLIDVRTAQIERSFIRDYKGEIDGLLQIMQEIADQISGIAGAAETKTAESKTFRLSVKSNPSGAEIRINGRSIGQTPFESSVKAGVELEIHLQKENYNDYMQTVVVNDDVNINIDLKFTDAYKQELLSRGKKPEEIKGGEGGGGSTWWWIGGGAVAIGAAAVILSSSHGDETTPVTTDAGFPEPPARP
jgi:TolB-like protein